LKKWQGELDNFFQLEYKAAASRVEGTKGGDVKQLQFLKDYAKKADKVARKTHKFDQARVMLERAKSEAVKLRDAPQGEVVSSQKQLEKLPAVWAKAVRDFQKGLADLLKVVKIRWNSADNTADDQAKVRGVKRLDRVFKKVSGLFAGHAFDDCVKILCDDAQGLNVRRK